MDNASDCHSTLKDTVCWASELDRFHLAAGGGKWSGTDDVASVLIHARFALWLGQNIVMSECVGNCCHIMGCHVSLLCIDCCVKPQASNLLESSGWVTD